MTTSYESIAKGAMPPFWWQVTHLAWRIFVPRSDSRIAWVARTAVNSETMVPMPSVNAKPATPAKPAAPAKKKQKRHRDDDDDEIKIDID